MDNKDLQAISDLLDTKLVPINKRLDAVEENQNKFGKRLGSIEESQNKFDKRLGSIEENQNKLDKKIDLNHQETMKEFQAIKSQIDDIDIKNANGNVKIADKINTIEKDIKFLKSRSHENEEEIFSLKEDLKAVK